MHDVLNELIEYKVVLEKANKVIHGESGAGLRRSLGSVNNSQHSVHLDQEQNVFQSVNTDPEELKEDLSRISSHRGESSFREVSIRYVAGTINKDEILRFKRILFRVSRGKIL